MKRKLLICAVILFFVVGAGAMSYPIFSAAVNNYASRSQAQEYTETVKLLPSDKNTAIWNSAEQYNKSLNNNVILTDPFDEEAYRKIGAGYENALNVDGNGLIGYIDVPKINIYLPIYHGTDSEILSKGAGHLQNTSLPVGGKSTHAIISAHSGYPGKTFFDYLTDMETGDEFYIHVLDRTLKYEVDQVKVVLPEKTEDLRIISGEDHVTLLTCTPYSVNTHRLLVRGARVDYDDSKEIVTGASPIASNGDYLFVFGYKIPYWAVIAFISAVVAAVIIIALVCVKRSRKKEKRRADGGGD